MWTTNKTLSITLAALTLIAGVLPAGVAFVGAQIVDAVIHAADLHRRTGTAFLTDVVRYVAMEALLVARHRHGATGDFSRSRCCVPNWANAST